MTPVQPRASLAAIITAARAGSTRYAAALFEAGGYAERTDDPAALATKARLLKDQALCASGPERPRLLVAASQAYGAADALRPQPHTSINEASMGFLAGDRTRPAAIARGLLEWMADAPALAETPYFIAATRAEAYLLCGDLARATDDLRRACQADPDGWTDRAATLRQFALLLHAMGEDQAWLDEFRAPRSLNFAGHLGVAPADSQALREQVDAWMAEHAIGFGFGALAAGADIIIAEALLARGGELHVVLPISVEAFVAQSVAPYDPAWRDRFAACLAAAHSLKCVTSLGGAYEPLATRLAADVAMGATVLNAQALHSAACQLLVIDDGPGRFGTGFGTRDIGERWRGGGEQHCIVAARNTPVPASGLRTEPEGRRDRRLAAMLMITFDGLDGHDETRFAEALDTIITPFRHASALLPGQPDLTLPMGNARLVAFADPDAAWSYARGVLALAVQNEALQFRIAGHYAIAYWLEDPVALVGPAIAELAAIATAALPGVLTASETLAAALFVNLADYMLAEHIGEVGDVKLYALNPIDLASE